MSADVDPAVTAAVVAGAFTLPGVWWTWRNGKKANSLETRKVDQEAYDRAITFYKDQLTYMQQQVDRLLANQDKMSAQVSTLEGTNRTQLDEIASLKRLLDINQLTITQLQDTVSHLQAQLQAATANGTPMVKPHA